MPVVVPARRRSISPALRTARDCAVPTAIHALPDGQPLDLREEVSQMRLTWSARSRNMAVFAAAALIAAGCAGNGVDHPEAVEAVDLDEIEEAVAIEFYYGLGGYLGEVVEDFIDRFNESQDNVVVTGVTQGSYEETGQALQAAVAAGDPPRGGGGPPRRGPPPRVGAGGGGRGGPAPRLRPSRCRRSCGTSPRARGCG
jgi:hypothetical protein